MTSTWTQITSVLSRECSTMRRTVVRPLKLTNSLALLCLSSRAVSSTATLLPTHRNSSLHCGRWWISRARRIQITSREQPLCLVRRNSTARVHSWWRRQLRTFFRYRQPSACPHAVHEYITPFFYQQAGAKNDFFVLLMPCSKNGNTITCFSLSPILTFFYFRCCFYTVYYYNTSVPLVQGDHRA